MSAPELTPEQRAEVERFGIHDDIEGMTFGMRLVATAALVGVVGVVALVAALIALSVVSS